MNRRQLLSAGIGVLGAQGIASVALSRSEYLPNPRPLSELPQHIGRWVHKADLEVHPRALEMLEPDDFLHREYVRGDGTPLTLFIGYYKTHHRSRNAHDPKVCLPGSGWQEVQSSVISVPVEGARPLPVNHYVVTMDGLQTLVLYWYQNHNRAVAEQPLVRLDHVVQMLRENRTDVAFVRIVLPAPDLSPATREGVQFIQDFYPSLMRQFPLPHS